jgi:8-oxo-dGTP diphosphatase
MVRTPTLGVAGVIRFENKVLIGQRGVDCKASAGLWSFPGGRVEDGELAADAMIRELKEETNLDVQHIYGATKPCSTTHPFAVTDHLSDDYGGKKHNHITLWYNMSLTEEAIKAGKTTAINCEPTKCEGWYWMTWKEIEGLPNINDPEHHQYLWVPLKMLRWAVNS